MRQPLPGTFVRRAIALGAALALGPLAGCDMCETGDLRCRGSVVQECSSTRNWEDSHDCGEYTCGVGTETCGDPWIPVPPGGEVWCCYRAP